MRKFDTYSISIKRKIWKVVFIETVYETTHPDHISLWLAGKKLEDYFIYKNDEVIIFPPNFIVNPNVVSLKTMEKLQFYIVNWKNNHSLEHDNAGL